MIKKLALVGILAATTVPLLDAQPTATQDVVTLTVAGHSVDLRTYLIIGASHDFRLTFRSKTERVKVKVVLSSTGAQPKRQVTVFEKEVTAIPGVQTSYQGTLIVPSDLRKGQYVATAEVEGQTGTGRQQVTVSEPLLDVSSFLGATKVNGWIEGTVERMLPRSKLSITRVSQAPVPIEWWSPDHDRKQTSAVVNLAWTTNTTGPIKFAAALPADMGAGKFRAHLERESGEVISQEFTFAFDYAPAAPGKYTIMFYGLSGAKDTDEVSDDEIYAVVSLSQRERVADPGSVRTGSALLGPVELNDALQSPLRNTWFPHHKLFSFEELYPDRLIWTVTLFENDGGKPEKYYQAIKAIDWSAVLVPPVSAQTAAQLHWDTLMTEHKRQATEVSNVDDILGWKSVPLTDKDLLKARTVRDGHMQKLEFKGDGGHYSVFVCLLAEPIKK